MKQNLLTNTGRGLKWALVGEVVVAAFFVAALLSHIYVRLTVVGFLLGGLLGAVSIQHMWRGQEEFGPAHRKQARRGTYAFLLAAVLFVLALLSFNTFTSATTGNDLAGGNETTSPTPAHRFKDLKPPIVLLAFAVIVEAASGALLLWELVGDSWRRLVQGYAALGVVVAVGVIAQGLRIVSGLELEAGTPQLDTGQQAQYYFDRFLSDLLPVFLGGFLILRAVAYVLARHAVDKIAAAEDEARRQAASAVEAGSSEGDNLQ